jgi:hypothetical protein
MIGMGLIDVHVPQGQGWRCVLRGRETGADKLDHLHDGEAVGDHQRLGTADGA